MIFPKRSLALIAGILVTQSLLSFPSFAADNAPGATPLVASTAVATESTDSADDAESLAEQARVQAQADRMKFEQSITELEQHDGAYGAAVSEAYLGHGKALHTLEMDEEALESYGKALQALRVSDGLFDVRQLPVLQQQATAQETLKNWEDVDATRHLIYYISMKQMPAGSPSRFDALLELARWKFRVSEQQLLTGNIDRGNESADLYRNEIQAMQGAASYPEKNIQMSLLYLELAAVEYQQAKRKNELPITEYLTTQQRTISRVECQTVRTPDGRLIQVCQNIETPNMEYYLTSTVKKNQDVGGHLANMKASVMSAYELLQQETTYPEDRNELLGKVQGLTNAYNTFLSDNKGSR